MLLALAMTNTNVKITLNCLEIIQLPKKKKKIMIDMCDVYKYTPMSKEFCIKIGFKKIFISFF